MAIASPNLFPATGVKAVDGLLSGSYWDLGSDRKITWSLGNNTLYQWNSNALPIVQAAFDSWEAVINVDFDYMGAYRNYALAPSDIVLTVLDRAFFGEIGAPDAYALGISPHSRVADDFVSGQLGFSTVTYPNPEGDIILNRDSPIFEWDNPGSRAFQTVLHEIGHAIGLKHPFDHGMSGLAGNITYAQAGLSHLNNGFLTLMSYGATSSSLEHGSAASPLPLDIWAAQRLYGVNTTTNAGDSRHTLLNDSRLRTIYDVSGNDTLDASSITKGITLDLYAGRKTTISDLTSVYVALGSTIENAIGTNWNDIIYGEEGTNILSGLHGNDTIQGLGGNDFLYGDFGNDLIFGQDGNDELQGGSGNDELQGGPGDDLSFGGDGIDLIFGQDGNDRLFGQDGNDELQGGAGLDLFKGGAGNDTLFGDGGFDSAYYDSNRVNFTQSKVGEVTIFADNLGLEGTDQLTSIERAYFTDYSVNLTVKSKSAVSNIASSDLQQLQELYVAFFNRVPDADGLEYWIGQFNSGQSINQIAESFYNSGIAFSELTGISAGMTNTSFINVVYNNVLGRSSGADPEGLSFWTSALQSGAETKATLVASIITSAHQFKGDAQWGWVADLLDNKVEVANLFSVEYGLNNLTSAESISNGIAIAAAVTPTDTTAAIELIGIGSTPIEFI